jgi:hypothetical protein
MVKGWMVLCFRPFAEWRMEVNTEIEMDIKR